MSQEQIANIFGFVINDKDRSDFEKTATFFNPKVIEKDSSFTTQNTDATRETSSQSTPEQSFKNDLKERHCNGKRIVSAHLHNYHNAWPCKDLSNPDLISQKSTPPIDPIYEVKRQPLIRNCISQESVRCKTIEPTDFFRDMGNYGCYGENHNGKRLVILKQSPFVQANRQVQNVAHLSDNEYGTERGEANETTELLSTNQFRIRTQNPNGKTKIAKFNKIKVIRAIPDTDSVNSIVAPPSFLKQGPALKKTLKIDTTKPSLEIQVDESRQKPISPFCFPSSASSKSRVISPIQPQYPESVGKNNVPVSANLKRVPTFFPNCDDYETLKAPSVQEESRCVGNFPSENINYLNLTRNIEVGPLGSPVVRTVSGICPKKSNFGTMSNAQSPCGQMELRVKIQARVNPKFKNQEAVLNKLFNPASQRK